MFSSLHKVRKRYSWFHILLFTGWASLACQRSNDSTQFRLLDPRLSVISFSNDLKESVQFNILHYLYCYNGGGVAIGDINNGGLNF